MEAVEGASHDASDKLGKKRRRKPKAKWVMLLGYCGTGYCGLQLNDNVPTIEKELMRAFGKTSVVPPHNLDFNKVRGDFDRPMVTDEYSCSIQL